MNLLFLDLETTGLDPEKHAITEIAANFIPDYEKDNKPLKTFQKKIPPPADSTINLQALMVNKQRLKDYPDPNAPFNMSLVYTVPAVTTSSALREFMDWLLDIRAEFGEFILTGHNIQFDKRFMEAALAKYNIEGFEAIVGYRLLDIASIGIFAMLSGLAPGLTKASNEEMMKFFGRAKLVSQSHTATMDIESTEYNLRRFIQMVKKDPIQVTA